MKIIVRNDTDKRYKFQELDFEKRIFPEGLSVEYDRPLPIYENEEAFSVVIKPLKNKAGEYNKIQALQPVSFKYEMWVPLLDPWSTDEEIYESGLTCKKSTYNNIVQIDILPHAHFELTIL